MSTAARREREKERRRNEIIDAAEALVLSKGYANVTTEDIAAQAELARGTLYLYFKNKDDIFLAIATRGAQVLSTMFKENSEGASTGLEKVKGFISAFNQFCHDYPVYYLINWQQKMPYGSADPKAVEEMKRVRSKTFRIIEDAIREGVRDGSMREDVNPVLGTLFWMAAYQSVVSVSSAIEMFMDINNVDHLTLIQYAADMLLRSLEQQ